MPCVPNWFRPVTGLANRNYLVATRLAFLVILAFDDAYDYRGASNSHSHDTLGPTLNGSGPVVAATYCARRVASQLRAGTLAYSDEQRGQGWGIQETTKGMQPS